MIFVDTNIFLRFLLADVTDQHAEAKTLFLDAATGKKHVVTSTMVLFELYWVLSSFYGKNKKEISHVLTKILSMHFIDIENREIVEKAVIIYKDTPFDLEDAYNISFAKIHGIKDFKTFDKKLRKKFIAG